MKIVATCIGDRKEIIWKGKKIMTGIFKAAVNRSIFLGTGCVIGDAVCEREDDEGIDQAVYGYSLQHYAYWKLKFPDLNWQLGMFGENLTIDGLDESKLHVGDTFEVGEVILEVTKPREPCMKLGVRFKDMKMLKQFWKQDFPGVYFKVLQTGRVQTNDEFILIKSHTENSTIAEVYQNIRAEKGR